MRHIGRLIAAFSLMAFFTLNATAQYVSPVDFMRYNPRAAFGNPAFYTADYGYFDLGLGGINIGVQNIGLKYDRFFQFDNQGYPAVIDLDAGIARMRDNNYLNSYMNVDIFNCGRRTKHGFFTYSHRMRELMSLRYTKATFELLANGNASYLGANNPANMELAASAKVFQEFGFGYQMSLTEQLNIGARFKFLMGFADAKTSAFHATLVTDPNTYALSLDAGADVRGAFPYEFQVVDGELKIVDARFNIANLFKNYGMGIDLGAEYSINEQFGVAAAINDLGFITWSNHPVRFVADIVDAGSFYQNGSFVFSGLTPDQVGSIVDDPDYLSLVLDSLKQYFHFAPETITKYTAGLNTNMMVRGYYDLTPQHRFSAQLMGYNMGLGMKPAMTLAYTGSFVNKYDVVATYTMMPGSYDNIGIGLSANFGGFLIYVASNNILGFFNPANISQVNAQFGISFTSAERISRSETIILRDQEESNDAMFGY